MESCGNLDKGIPAFRKEGNQYREIHEDKVAYASLNARGKIQLEATPPFNDGAVLSETHDRKHISAGMTLLVTHRFNQKQIQKPINELTTPMMLFFNCLTQLLILNIVTIVKYSHLLRCTL